MSSGKVKRLFDMEIDEVSLVDRAANQHARVAIAKNDDTERESNMPVIYDAAGSEVFEDELEHGGTYFDDAGNEYVYYDDSVTDEADEPADEEEDDVTQERELVGVGKRGAKAKTPVRKQLAGKKSLGSTVLEELSKALDQGERDTVISKAMDLVAKADARARNAENIAKSLQDERDMAQYVELAKGYQLPVNPEELGAVLKSAAATMSEAELNVLDRVLTSAGEANAFAEIGSNGTRQSSSIMDEVAALANEAVGKYDMSEEQAIVAMFGSNPAAYDEYLSER